MTTYAELMAQSEQLRAQAEALRTQERAASVAEVRALMAAHGLTIEDIDPSRRSAARQSGRASRATAGGPGVVRQVRYRGPNGETWTGGPGRRPAWVSELAAQGASIEQYRVAA